LRQGKRNEKFERTVQSKDSVKVMVTTGQISKTFTVKIYRHAIGYPFVIFLCGDNPRNLWANTTDSKA